MKYSFTIFKSIFDNKTHRRMEFSNWDEFVSLLFKLSEQPGYKPKRGERKQGSPLISPAIFKNNGRRCNDNVDFWGGWIALDVDDYEGDFENAADVFSKYTHVRYSSASSTREKPKFRVILPCTTVIPASDIRHMWYAANKEFKSLGDPQTKDLSRMYYVPARYPDSYQFIVEHRAEFLNPKELLAKYPYASAYKKKTLSDVLPEHIQTQIAKYRKEKLTNTSYKWSGYRDCPFVNRNLVSEYKCIHGTGWYAKMYSIMMSIAAKAVKCGYPIEPSEISALCREIDVETGGWYANRDMEKEAARAIHFAICEK
jgi:hypothetical protein